MTLPAALTLFVLVGLLTATFLALAVMQWRNRQSAGARLDKTHPAEAEPGAGMEAIGEVNPRLRTARLTTEKSASAGNGGFYEEAEARLEQAFVQLERGRISLQTYRTIVLVERGEAERRLQICHQTDAKLAADREKAIRTVQDIGDAIAIIDWCLDWADREERRIQLDADVDGAASLPN
jgi:hypothetical protein